MVDQKLTQLTSSDATADTDWLYFVDDPAGTPVSKARSIGEFITDNQAGSTDMQEGTSQILLATPYSIANGGTSDFPTAPVTGQTHFRTDLGYDCYYDSDRWLTTHEMHMSRTEANLSSDQDFAFVLPAKDYNINVSKVNLDTFVNATNDSDNYWTVQVVGRNLARTSSDVIYSAVTDSDSPSTWTEQPSTPTDASPTNQENIIFTTAKTGAPGNLTMAISMEFRYIIT
jgi:hypothetical protein